MPVRLDRDIRTDANPHIGVHCFADEGRQLLRVRLGISAAAQTPADRLNFARLVGASRRTDYMFGAPVRGGKAVGGGMGVRELGVLRRVRRSPHLLDNLIRIDVVISSLKVSSVVSRFPG
jgi:hypothetical protein